MRIYLILFFILLIGNTVNAEISLYSVKQDHFTKFESLTEKDGLPGKEVYDIIQDSIGFMWFATDNGLCRYDGFGFVIYQNKINDPSSISNNLITCLEIDKKGNLWIGTENGLNLFNRRTESFTSFHKSTKTLNSLDDNHIKGLYSDNEENLWIETASGILHKLEIETLEIRKYKHNRPKQPYYRYHAIYEDKLANLWIGGRGLPVTKFDRKSEKFIYFKADASDENKKRDDDVTCYFEDSNNKFWISSIDGVYLMDRTSGVFTKVLRGSAFSIIEDNNGNIWIGSSMGLLQKKHGQKSLINYRKNQDNPFSITDNRIYKIYEDKSGVIWIATANGLTKFSPNKYKFGNYRHIGNLPNTLSGNMISSIIEDKKGQVWIGTQNNGLNKLIPSSGQIKYYSYTGNIKSGLSSNRISTLYLDKNDAIWIGLWAGIGFNKLNLNNESFTHYAYDYNSLKRDWYNDFLELEDGRFFCGMWGALGFTEFDRKKEVFTNYHFLNLSRPKNSSITAIHFTNNNIYLGSNNYRLYRFKIANNQFIAYHKSIKNHKNKKIDLPLGMRLFIVDVAFKNINALHSYDDKFLLSASDKGLIIKNIRNESFKTITKNRDSRLLSDNIASFYSYSSDTLCLLTSNGLNFFDLKNQKLLSFSIALKEVPISVLRIKRNLFLIYSNVIKKFNLNDNTISDEYYLNNEYQEVKFSCAIENTDHNIILGTNRGACIFDIEKGVIIEFFDKSFSNTKNWFSVKSLFKDSEQTIWIGTDIGFGKMNLDRSNIQWIRDSVGEVDRLINSNVQCFTEDENGNLWIGTETGCCIYNKKTKQISSLSSKGNYGLSSHLVNRLFEDIDGNIWLGYTDYGLNVIFKNGEIVQYLGDKYDSTGFRSKNVNVIFQDSRKTIWVGGDKGLNKFERIDKVVKNFTVENGLAHNSIMAIQEDDDEQLWIATRNGISRFNLNSEKVIQNYYKLDGLQDNSFNKASSKLKNGILMFGGDNGITTIDPSSIRKNKQIPSISFTALSKHNELISTEIVSGDTIVLNPKTKFFSIEFAALDFTESLQNRYRYRLTGSFNDWIDLGNEHKISFANLASGRYKLHISASNNEGIWNEEGIYLVLIIRPPFWKTWWFISSIILIVLIIIFSMLAMKISSLEKEKKNWQLEQRLLRTQMNPHFIFNILAALQGLIYQKETKIVVSYLSKFAALMRSILYHSREESIILDDEIIFIENYLKLQQLRFSERFNYKIKVDIALNKTIVSIPPMLLQPFIENSIEHGLREKFKTDGQILISFDKIDNELGIAIEDNGIGIEHVKKLKDVKGKTHKSLGIATTLERIQKINKGNSKKDLCEIIDLADPQTNKSGTRVSFRIPLTEDY